MNYRRLFLGLFVGVMLQLVGCKEKPTPQLPPVSVIASEVLVRDQFIHLEKIGQAVGAQDVEIRARVEGILETLHFQEGSIVNEGDLLYTIDPRTLESNLEQTRGNLGQAMASLDKARRDVARLTPLWEKNAISRQMLDDALAAERSSEGAVNSAQASVESMEIQLGYANIVAPITGLIGKTEVKPGNLVGRGQSTLLTTISSLDPIHFRFSISEQEYLQWRRAHPENPEAARQARSDVFELILADGMIHEHRGNVVFIDRSMDTQTGTLLIEVAFPNPQYMSRPGQFGRVRAPIRRIENAMLVPQRAVAELQATYSVYIVTPDNRAQLRSVTPGPRIGNLYVIESGLSPGDIVVVEGGQKLQNGTVVSTTIRPITTDLE